MKKSRKNEFHRRSKNLNPTRSSKVETIPSEIHSIITEEVEDIPSKNPKRNTIEAEIKVPVNFFPRQYT